MKNPASRSRRGWSCLASDRRRAGRGRLTLEESRGCGNCGKGAPLPKVLGNALVKSVREPWARHTACVRNLVASGHGQAAHRECPLLINFGPKPAWQKTANQVRSAEGYFDLWLPALEGCESRGNCQLSRTVIFP